jgi:hypothetical protein
MASDFTFDIRDDTIYNGFAHRACRSAVLWPLVCARPGEARPSVPDAYARLQGQWRQRVRVLKQSGWSVLNATAKDNHENSKLQWFRNCPPFGVEPSVRARVCHRIRVCPMCYAREVVAETYRALEFACWRAVVSSADRGQLKLVAVKRTFRDRPLSTRSLEEYVEHMTSGGLRSDYKRLKDAGVRVLAARSGMTVEPGQTPATVTIVRGTLAVIPTGCDLPGFGEAAKIRQCEVIRADLANLVGWCFPYPRGMLRGDPDLTREILDVTAQKRAKLVASFDAADNRAIRDAVRAALSGKGVSGEE